MPDLRDRIRDLDLLDVPDVMQEARRIEHPRAPLDPGPSPARRVAIAVLMLALATAAIVYATRPFFRTNGHDRPANRQEGPTSSVCRWVQTSYDLPSLAGPASLVAGTSPQDLWVYEGALDGGDPALLHFDGAEWRQVALPDARIAEMQAAGPDDLWIANGRAIWRFDGTSWTDLEVPADIASHLEYGSLEVFAPDDVWIAGWNGEDVVLRWDGAGWTTSYRGGISVQSIDVWSPSDVWAVGSARSGRFDLLPQAMHWDGTEWTLVPMKDREPGQTQQVAESVIATGPFEATVATSRGIYVWDGSRWTIHRFRDDPRRYGWTLHPGATATWGMTVGMRGNDVVRWDGNQQGVTWHGNAWEVHRVVPEDQKTSDWSYDMVTFGDMAVVVGGWFRGPSTVNAGAPQFAIRVDC